MPKRKPKQKQSRYFIAAGVHPGNKGGLTSKVWHVWRRGSHVYWEFGPVEFVNRGVKMVRWAAMPQSDPPRKMRTVRGALDEIERRIKEKLAEVPAYVPMPPGTRILPRPLRT